MVESTSKTNLTKKTTKCKIVLSRPPPGILATGQTRALRLKANLEVQNKHDNWEKNWSCQLTSRGQIENNPWVWGESSKG